MSKKTRKKTTKKTLEKSSSAAAAKPASGRSKSSAKKPATKKNKPAPKPAVAKPAVAKPAVAKPAVAKPAVAKPGKRGASPAAPKAKTSSASKSNAALKTATKSEAKTTTALASSAVLTEGAKAPSFRLPRDGGETISLADFAGQRLVLFFYPRADTPGCTKEAIDFTRLAKSFAESKTAVVGVSADPIKAQESFRNKHQLATPLVSDEQHDMLSAYGAWGEKSMYGRTFLGVLRTTVLIGADGRIAKIWRHVKVDGHADEVLETIRVS